MLETSLPDNKDNSLRRYKVETYQQLGFTEYQARRLADVHGLDIGTVRTQLIKGCPAAIAYRIYRP